MREAIEVLHAARDVALFVSFMVYLALLATS